MCLTPNQQCWSFGLGLSLICDRELTDFFPILDLPMFEEMPTDLGIMTCMTVPVEEVSLQLNRQLN